MQVVSMLTVGYQKLLQVPYLRILSKKISVGGSAFSSHEGIVISELTHQVVVSSVSIFDLVH